ncbi:DUF4870 family protein [Pseudomonas sp. TSRC2-2]|uniref:DUF4870 family protein n=1 Tax=Pseudomonas sp. TSRC2-2 TaxID=2804571 RepID=UPI003CEB3E2C
MVSIRVGTSLSRCTSALENGRVFMSVTKHIPRVLPPQRVALLIYLLYISGYFFGITALVGTVIALVYKNCPDEVLATHFRAQLRLCCWSLLWVVLGGLTVKAGVGYIVLTTWFFWSVWRIALGLFMLSKHRPTT